MMAAMRRMPCTEPVHPYLPYASMHASRVRMGSSSGSESDSGTSGDGAQGAAQWSGGAAVGAGGAAANMRRVVRSRSEPGQWLGWGALGRMDVTEQDGQEVCACVRVCVRVWGGGG